MGECARGAARPRGLGLRRANRIPTQLLGHDHDSVPRQSMVQWRDGADVELRLCARACARARQAPSDPPPSPQAPTAPSAPFTTHPRKRPTLERAPRAPRAPQARTAQADTLLTFLPTTRIGAALRAPQARRRAPRPVRRRRARARLRPRATTTQRRPPRWRPAPPTTTAPPATRPPSHAQPVRAPMA
jgi:hypothetical protein